MLKQFSFTVCLFGASELFRAFFFFKIKGHPDKNSNQSQRHFLSGPRFSLQVLDPALFPTQLRAFHYNRLSEVRVFIES